MRVSTVASFLVAVLLAAIAVFGVRAWLSGERQQISETIRGEITAQQERRAKRTLVVAAEPMAFGELITPTKLREIEWSGDFRPEGSFEKISDLVKGDEPKDARYALGNISVNEPILTDRITIPGQRAKLSTALEDGKKAVSIRVNDVLGVAGFVLPGDRVDILLSRGSGGGAFVDVLLQGVKVLAIDQKSNSQADQPSLARTITLEVDTEQAQKLVLAANVGTMSLALRNLSSTDVRKFQRVKIGDLNEIDAAEDILAKALADAAVAEVDPKVDESLERVGELEALLSDLSSTLENRISSVEEAIDDKNSVVIEPVVVEPAKKVIPNAGPKQAKVWVVRNGRRVEYKVLTRAKTE
mgnify:FL=1